MQIPWDQRLARQLVKPLAHTSITPNQITGVTVALALLAALLFASGDQLMMNWAAGLFVLARFLDHFDGELARLTGKTSKLGYILDYVAGAISYAAFFFSVGIGLSSGPLGLWAIGLGSAGALCALLAMPVNMGIDETTASDDAVGYPALAGVELEDAMYLIAPITWFGFLSEFFVLAGVGAVVYLIWSSMYLLKRRKI